METMRDIILFSKNALVMEVPTKKIRKDKGKSCADGYSDRQRTERPPRKYFRCVSVDHKSAKFSKTPKDNEKRRNIVHFNER